MIGLISKIWTHIFSAAKRRKQLELLDGIRRQIADSGYALEDLTDSELETAITNGAGEIENFAPLTGKTIYWTLRRLSPDDRQLVRRKIKQPLQMQATGFF